MIAYRVVVSLVWFLQTSTWISRQCVRPLPPEPPSHCTYVLTSLAVLLSVKPGLAASPWSSVVALGGSAALTPPGSKPQSWLPQASPWSCLRSSPAHSDLLSEHLLWRLLEISFYYSFSSVPHMADGLTLDGIGKILEWWGRGGWLASSGSYRL